MAGSSASSIPQSGGQQLPSQQGCCRSARPFAGCAEACSGRYRRGRCLGSRPSHAASCAESAGTQPCTRSCKQPTACGPAGWEGPGGCGRGSCSNCTAASSLASLRAKLDATPRFSQRQGGRRCGWCSWSRAGRRWPRPAAGTHRREERCRHIGTRRRTRPGCAGTRSPLPRARSHGAWGGQRRGSGRKPSPRRWRYRAARGSQPWPWRPCGARRGPSDSGAGSTHAACRRGRAGRCEHGRGAMGSAAVVPSLAGRGRMCLQAQQQQEVGGKGRAPQERAPAGPRTGH